MPHDTVQGNDNPRAILVGYRPACPPQCWTHATVHALHCFRRTETGRGCTVTRRDPLKVAPASVDDDGMVEDAVLGLDGDASTLAPGEDPDRLMSVAQVARRLDCSVSLVQKWRRFGWLPAQQLGPPDVPIYGYRLGDVERFAAEKWNRKRGRPAGSTTKTEDGSAPRRPVRVARPVPDGLDQPAATVGPVIGGQDAGSQLPRAPRARKPKPAGAAWPDDHLGGRPASAGCPDAGAPACRSPCQCAATG